MKESGLFVVAVMLLCSLFGIVGAQTLYADPTAATASAQPAEEAGKTTGQVNLTEALANSDPLIMRAVHDEVIKIAPYDYVTRSLMAQNFKIKKKTKDHKVAVYASSTDDVQISVATAYTATAVTQAAIDFGAVGNKSIAVNQTITFPTIPGYKADGTTADGHALVCYVLSKDSSDKPILKPRNGKLVSGVITIPTLAQNTPALRGLRTGTETQIRTQPYGVIPTPTEYYIQKNIIEFETTGWWDNATKEVKWTDRDIMEMALAEKTRTSMVDFWLGKTGSGMYKTEFNKKEELAYFHEGVWYQAGRSWDFNGVIDLNTIIEFGRYLFTGNRSSNVKYLAMGSNLSAAFQKVIFDHPILLGETYKDKELNITFTAVNFFGGKKLMFVDDPSLDDIGMGDCGFVFDMRYAFEYNYGLKVINLDGEKTQDSDTKGQAIVEENCFILANKESHCRVTL